MTSSERLATFCYTRQATSVGPLRKHRSEGQLKAVAHDCENPGHWRMSGIPGIPPHGSRRASLTWPRGLLGSPASKLQLPGGWTSKRLSVV